MARKIILCLILFLWPIQICADEVNFQWGQSTGIVEGYRIYWGLTSDGPYPNQLCEMNENLNRSILNCSAELNPTIKYYLICRAYNTIGESGDSNEICWFCSPENFQVFSFE